MKTSFRLSIVLTLLLSISLLAPLGRAQNTGPIANVEQLKSEAFKALRGGQFDRTSELLKQASSLTTDANLKQMNDWVTQFQSQQQEFISERNKGYEKTVAEVKKLQAAG